jgi:hypothetical protein
MAPIQTVIIPDRPLYTSQLQPPLGERHLRTALASNIMSTVPNSKQYNRKRQRTEIELSQDDIPSLLSLPSKWLKLTGEPHPNSNSPPLAFCDNLSKVWLTRRALRERVRETPNLLPISLPHNPKSRSHVLVARIADSSRGLYPSLWIGTEIFSGLLNTVAWNFVTFEG